jgi:multidrug resistance efflux pump
MILPLTGNRQDRAGLELELSQAQTDLAQAQRQLARLQGLLAERAVPARRVEEAKADEDRARGSTRPVREPPNTSFRVREMQRPMRPQAPFRSKPL